MKNWAKITIFMAAMAFSAAAQQPSASQSTIIHPGEPVTIASEKQGVQSLSSSLNSPGARPQADLKKMAGELNERQRDVIEQHNQQMKQRFTSLQQAGGWQRVFLTQLKLQRLDDPKATQQLNASQRFITNFVFCDQPLIAGQTSEFQTSTNNFRLGTVSKQFAVEPQASIIINGCSFGPDAGEVRLILNYDTGSFVSLEVSDWSDSSIFATLEAIPAIPDQEAQLVVIRKDGTQSAPMTIEFFQHRVARVFTVPGHLEDLRVAADRHLTE
jgi:Skp family chaperone for outer membrane proteins